MKEVPSQFPAQLPARIAFVAEAPADVELAQGYPLAGPSGKVFNRLLADSRILRADCYVGNVFPFQLPKNDITQLAGPRADDSWPTPVGPGKYLPRVLVEEQRARLRDELLRSGASVVVALGGTAAWALLDLPASGTITRIRGTVHEGVLTPQKVIPTFHPAALLHNKGKGWNKYPVLWSDFLKAARESAYPEIRQTYVETFIVPKTPSEVESLFARLHPPVAVDIETSRGLIDCIGFSDKHTTFTVPIFDLKTFRPYWSATDELVVRAIMARWLEDPTIDKLFQFGSYDVQQLWEIWRVRVHAYTHDTFLLHHALWPELPRDLGTMAALHTDLPPWKPIKGRGVKGKDL